MKKIFLLSLVLICTASGSFAQQKDVSMDADIFFSGKKIAAQKTADLFILGKVWGFLKYFHPQIAAGKFDWDKELVNFLPGYLKINTANERSDSLFAWINRLGEVPAKKAGDYDTIKNAKLRPDFSWISMQHFSPELVAKLKYILDNRAQGDQYYIKFHSGEGLNIPEFAHEKGYGTQACPTADYRMVALFRFWNVIEYWYPYKYNLGKPWDKVLQDHIPAMVQASTAAAYTLDVEKLVSFIKDGHSFISSKTAEELRGFYFNPFIISAAEGKFIISSISNEDAAKKAGIEKGDIIEQINGRKINEIYTDRIQYIPAPTIANGKLEFARDLSRTTDSVTVFGIRRGNEFKRVTVNNLYSRKVVNRWQPVLPYQRDSSLCILKNNIGYINVGNVKTKDSVRIKQLMNTAAALIIDVRQNMVENGEETNPYFIISQLLREGPPANNFTTQQPQFAGVFKFVGKEFLPNDSVAYHYKKKIAILIDADAMSVGESMAMDFSLAYDATLIGTATSGTNGMNSRLLMPGNMMVGFSGTGNYWMSGKEIERIGIQPDVKAAATIEGYKKGLDMVLEKAIDFLSTKIK
jgi:C-terminal processing protease CtpA/Prc